MANDDIDAAGESSHLLWGGQEPQGFTQRLGYHVTTLQNAFLSALGYSTERGTASEWQSKGRKAGVLLLVVGLSLAGGAAYLLFYYLSQSSDEPLEPTTAFMPSNLTTVGPTTTPEVGCTITQTGTQSVAFGEATVVKTNLVCPKTPVEIEIKNKDVASFLPNEQCLGNASRVTCKPDTDSVTVMGLFNGKETSLVLSGGHDHTVVEQKIEVSEQAGKTF